MDDPMSDSENIMQEENDSSIIEEDDSEESKDEDTKINWAINYEAECNFWLTIKNKGFIYLPFKCPTCTKGNFDIKKYKNKDIINPYYVRCNNTKCRKKNSLRNYSFLHNIKKLPCSVIFMILENWLFIGLNANKINKIIEDKYNINIKIRSVQYILEYFRKIIYLHMKLKYNTSLIGGFDHSGNSKIVAIDESLFIHNENNEAIWVLGGIETKDRKLRVSISKIRDTNALQNFINDNFLEGTHFNHDGWPGYNFLNNNINYTHETNVRSGI